MSDPQQNPPGRLLGIDYGTIRIGLALSDPLRVLAGGAGVVLNTRSTHEQIRNVAERNGVVKIIVGMPYQSDGTKGKKAVEVDEFISGLKQVVSVPIETWDESYTSIRAKQAFLEGGMRKKDRQQKRRVDEMAARLLLQDYLDSISRSHASNRGNRSPGGE